MFDYYSPLRTPNGELILSNSKLKELYATATGGKEQNKARREANFSFGSALHRALLEPEMFSNSEVMDKNKRIMLIGMVNAVYDAVGTEFFTMARKERPFFGKLFGHTFKGKLDWVYQPAPTHELLAIATEVGDMGTWYCAGRTVLDVKSTGAHDEKAFAFDAKDFDYDLQGFIYLNLAKAETFTLMGVQKSAIRPSIFWLTMERGGEMYQSGERKCKKYLEAIKPLIACQSSRAA